MSKRARASVVSIHNRDADLYDRQKRIEGWNQQRLKHAKVLVGGAGALGNEIVKNLVQIGVGKIVLVDFDHVVDSNLNRCVFFRAADSKRTALKAPVVAKRANALNRDVLIDPVVLAIEELSGRGYRGIDVAFSAFDNPGARFELCRKCWKYGIPVVDGRMSGFLGRVQTVIPPTTVCLGCLLSKEEMANLYLVDPCTGKRKDASSPFAAVATMGSLVAALQVNEALKLLMATREKDNFVWNIGKPVVDGYLRINLNAGKWRVVGLDKNKSCEICGTHG